MRAGGWRRLRAAAVAVAALNAAVLAGLLALPMPPEALPEGEPSPRLLLPPTPSGEAIERRGVAALDAILARRLSRAAEARGLRSEDLLPPSALRRAAIEAGDADAEALGRLTEAYREGFVALGLEAP